MTVVSTLGYGALPIGPVLPARSTENIVQVRPQTPPAPSSEASSDTGIASQPASLLSSSTTAELLNLTDAAPPKGNPVQGPKTITRDDVLAAVKRSKSYADGHASDGNRLGEIYTSKDIGFIRATTGYNVISIGKLTAIVDDDGNPPPSEEALNSVDQVASAIEGGRSFGGLTGEITPEYAKEMLDSYAALIKSFPKDWMDKAMTYLGGTIDAKPAEVSDRKTASG